MASKEYRETIIRKQNEIEALTSNLRELQRQLADDGCGVLYPTSRVNKCEGRPRARSVQVKLRSSSVGSDGSFKIRIPALPVVQLGSAPVRASSLDQYQIHTGDTDPDKEDQYDNDQGYDEDRAKYEGGDDQDGYDD